MQLIQAAERVRALFEPLVERAAKQPPPTQQPDTPPTLVTPPTPPPKTPTLAIVEPQPKLPPPPRVVRPAVLPPRTPSTPVVFGFSAGVALALDTAGAGLEGDAAFFVEPLGWLRFEPFIGVPLVPTRVSTDFGSADLYKGTLGARLGFRVVDTQGFDLLLGGGVAGVFLRAEGHASEGYRASTEDAFTASLLFDANASVQLTGPLWLSARGTLGLALPTPTILFANEPIMDWGLPWGTVEAALEVRFGE
ncbi:MAG: hypothetical protein U0271_03595 [Polyangiaceae bacterium]